MSRSVDDSMTIMKASCHLYDPTGPHSFRRKTWKGTHSRIEVKIPVLDFHIIALSSIRLTVIYVDDICSSILSVFLSVPNKFKCYQHDKISNVKVEPSV